MNNKQLAAHWEQSSDRDFVTVDILFENKQYPQSLFWGHLVLEKLLKAIYAKVNPQNPHAPKTHDLLFLAKRSGLEFSEEIVDKLENITDFNLSARYEDEKHIFYKQCTKEFTSEQIRIIKELRQWLKKLIEA